MTRFGVWLTTACAVIALVVGGLVVAPVSATILVLCKGVSTADTAACNPGYAPEMSKMHWRMYGGHNCTNYVAYQLGVNGVPEPTILMGNAIDWAANAKKIGYTVDSTPAVGSVGAWPGTKNHITYVAEVGPNYIVTHEDNYPGYYPKGQYQELKIYKGDSSYPPSFIHFRDFVTGGTPVVSGAAQVGSTLTSDNGTWSPSGLTYAYRWLRDGVAIPTGTKSTYTLTPDDVGHVMSYRVQGSKTGYIPVVKTSAGTDAVAPGTLTNSAAPTVSGDPVIGSTLAATTGTWSPSNLSYQIQWIRGGNTIAGATAETYKLTAADVGAPITAQVTAAADGYATATKTAAQTITGKPGTIDNSRLPAIAGTAKVGSALSGDDGTFSPDDATVTRQWLVDGVSVSGATGTTYVPVASNAGKQVSLRVTATKPGYTTLTRTSVATAPVEPEVPAGTNLVKTTTRVSVDKDGNATVNVSCTMACSGWVQVWSDSTGTQKSDVQKYVMKSPGWMSLTFTDMPYLATNSAAARVKMEAPISGPNPQFNPLTLTKIIPPANVVASTAGAVVAPDGSATVNVSCTMACSGWVQLWSDASGTKRSDVQKYVLKGAGYMPLRFADAPYVDSSSALTRIAKEAPKEAPSPQFNRLVLHRANVIRTTSRIVVDPDGRATLNVSCTTACSGWVQLWLDAAGTQKSDVRKYVLKSAGWMPLKFAYAPYATTPGARARIAIESPKDGPSPDFRNLQLTMR